MSDSAEESNISEDKVLDKQLEHKMDTPPLVEDSAGNQGHQISTNEPYAERSEPFQKPAERNDAESSARHPTTPPKTKGVHKKGVARIVKHVKTQHSKATIGAKNRVEKRKTSKPRPARRA